MNEEADCYNRLESGSGPSSSQGNVVTTSSRLEPMAAHHDYPERFCFDCIPLPDDYSVPMDKRHHWTNSMSCTQISNDLNWTDEERVRVVALLVERSQVYAVLMLSCALFLLSFLVWLIYCIVFIGIDKNCMRYSQHPELCDSNPVFALFLFMNAFVFIGVGCVFKSTQARVRDVVDQTFGPAGGGTRYDEMPGFCPSRP